MNGNCHLVYGSALGAAIALNIQSVSQVLPNITNTSAIATTFVLGGMLGGIFPDIDNPKSYTGKLTVPVSSVIEVVSGLFGKVGKNHRGIFHDPLCYIILLIVSYLYFPPMCGFFVGCLSHLFLDLFNPMGIPFLFGARHLHLGKIYSGSKGSVVFTWLNVFFVVGASVIFYLELF